uniref:DNA-directed RNA polymerases I and III subunit RPAC2 n=2 Tax=Parasteatoda tepidariorum TaxID=114398 RepID=A0A2L2YAT6_PARTP
MEQSNRRLEVLPCTEDDDTCRTFILKDEDHTLGNALRYIISKNPEVEYCGYSVPHPSVHDINFRIQTKRVPAAEVFKKGLEDLQTLCEHMNTRFQEALDVFSSDKHEKELEGMDT